MSISEARCPNCFSRMNHGATICSKCGCNIADLDTVPNALSCGATLHSNRYIIGRALGAGGFGITYLAFDVSSEERVAIKEYFPFYIAIREKDNSVQPTKDVEEYINGVNKFYGEAGVLYQLVNCRAVVSVSNFFCENNTAYIVMEYIEGTSLKELLNSSGGTVDYEFALHITIDIALSLSQVHRLGILHRDISPDNIMICPDCTARIIDFGASREYADKHKDGLSVIIKKAYAPPEQYSRKKSQGPFSDVYALAATFYRAVTGRNVPDALSRIKGCVQMSSVSELCPMVPQYVSDTIDRALSTDCSLRQQTMDDFAFELQNGRSGLTRVIDIEDDNCHLGDGMMALTSLNEENRPCLRVYYGSYCTGVYHVNDNTTVAVGRSKNMCDIVIKSDPLISRMHVRITPNSFRKETLVEDLSANGTFVIDYNMSSKLQKKIPTVVEDGALLQLATSDVLIQVVY